MAEGNIHSTTEKINQNTYDKNKFDNMQQLNDIFDILDDDFDPFEYSEDILNHFFTSGHLISTMNNERNNEDNDEVQQLTEDDSIHNNLDIQIIEDKGHDDILSQKLSQLSTKTNDDNDDHNETNSSVMNKRRRASTTSSPDVVISKKSKIMNDYNMDDDEVKEYGEIPSFLLSTDKSFEQMIKQIINIGDFIHINDLRHIAILTYQIANLHIEKQIKLVYLKSGTGTLKESEPDLVEIDRCVWPKQVISKILHNSSITSSTTAATTMDMNTENEHHEYEKFVLQHLQDISKKIQRYQEQLDEKKSHTMGLTPVMEDAIQHFVYEHGIRSLEMKRDLKIALVKYEYDAELIERRYLQENPNEYQIQIAHRLYDAKNQAEKSKRELLELKQRVFYNKPPMSYESIQMSMPISTTSHTTVAYHTFEQQQRLADQHKRMIQRKKLDTMAIHLVQAELKYYQDQNIFNDELSKMWQNHRSLVKNQGMSTILTNLIEQRFINITYRWREIYNYRIKYYLQYSLADSEHVKKSDGEEQQEQKVKTFGFIPHFIIDTTHSFNDKQIQVLNRGPTYVPPCQLHISSLCPSTDDLVKKQFAPLKHQIASLFTKHKIDVNTQMKFQNEIEQIFKDLFSLSIPSSLQQRALYEMKLVQTIRSSLKEHNLILRRTADHMNTFYLGNRQDFERKSLDYLTKTDAYELLVTTNNNDDDNEDNHQQQLQKKLNEIVHTINRGLKILKTTKALKEDVADKLLVNNVPHIQPSYLYFLPDVSKKNDISLVPFITSQQSVTSKLAKYLNRLLRPFADEKMLSTTFISAFDFVQKLNHYTTANLERCFTSTTTFCTIKLTNFYTLSTHRTMIDTVVYCLKDNLASSYLDKVPIVTIKNLLELILFNNIFVYQDQVYKFIRGGPNTMPLMITLSNIYLFHWQKYLLDIVMKHKKEFFGRCKDQIFFTWNGSNDALRTLLQTLRNTHSNVHFQTLIGSSVYFLDTYIENQHGQLYTRVYHDPTIQGYTLPYVVGHSKLRHSDWLLSALIRAVCCCSLVHDFNQERIYLELTYLVNGYSLLFVECHVQHFFNYFHADSMRYVLDQAKYDKFRRQWLDLINAQHHLSDKLQKTDDNGHLIRLNYLYEFGPRCEFNQKFHRLWSDYFNIHPVLSKKNSTIILTTKHVYSLNTLLAKYKQS